MGDGYMDKGCMMLVEGLDLAGKSTLTKSLVTELIKQGKEVSYARNAFVPHNPIAQKADMLRRQDHISLQETGGLFLAAHLYDALVFEYPKPDAYHIQDSCWLRTLAYNTMYETRFIPELVSACHQFQPKFDIVIYLTASDKARRERVLKRALESEENDTADYLSWINPTKLRKNDEILFEQTIKFYPQTRKIDTTDMSPDQVLQKALHLIESSFHCTQ